MTRTDRPVRVEQRGQGVVALWLNRPAARNALNYAMVAALGRPGA